VIDKIAEIAKATMAGEEARKLMTEGGVRVYWQGQAESEARIEADRAKNAELGEIIGN